MKRKVISPFLLALSLSVQSLVWTQAFAGDNGLPTAINSQSTAPKSIHRLYSDIDMRLSLATKKNMSACVAEQCEANHAFDVRVDRIGQQLAGIAYDLYPNLSKRVATFQFSVVDKKAEGTASNAKGDVVLFRGLQHLTLNDAALSFIIAREMGHVIGKHHTKNTSTKLIISAIASVVFPVAGLIAASSTAAQASTVTSLVTSVASTTTSLVGTRVAMISVKPKQLAESDAYANSLLESQNLDYHQVFNGLPKAEENSTSWLKDLQQSKLKLQARLKMKDVATTLAMQTY